MSNTRSFTIRLLLLCTCYLSLALPGTPAHAGGTFTVNTTTDAGDANPGDAICSTAAGNGGCSLRAAVIEANTLGGVSTINLPAGVYNLTIPSSAEEQNPSIGDLDLSGKLTLAGAGAGQTIVEAENSGDRVFQVLDQATVLISGITIRNGAPVPTTLRGGGGIYVGRAQLALDHVALTHNHASAIYGEMSTLILTDTTIISNSSDFGAGIYSTNASTLKMTDSSVLDNTANGPGGGLYNNGNTVTLSGVTIAGNIAKFGGGGIFNNSTMTAVNMTISGNQVYAFSSAGGAAGGAIFNDSGRLISLVNVTIVGNASTDLGGGLYNLDTGTIRLKNTIIANSPSGGNCAGTIASDGHNIDSGESCAFGRSDDRRDIDPLLGPLQNNGGPTRTHALISGSPAINAGDNTDCPATDQRGTARPQERICDIGAVEYQEGRYRVYLVRVSR